MASKRSALCAQESIISACSLCNSEDGKRWYYTDSREILCDWCNEVHARGKKTKNGDVGEANSQTDTPVPEICKLHPSKRCDMYCSDCNMLLCLLCFSQKHKQHNWTLLDDEFSSKKHQLIEHATIISAKLAHFKNEKLNQHCASKAFKDNIDMMRTEVNIRRTKLKDEVDSIADAVLAELLSLEAEESVTHKIACQKSERKVGDLTCLLEKAEANYTSSVSMFETERLLRRTLPLYDVDVEGVFSKSPIFDSESINRTTLAKMVGLVLSEKQYQKVDINSEHVRSLSKFTVTQRKQILGICPVDNCHAWLSILNYKCLALVNREGVVTEKVELGFCPSRITKVGQTDILMTSIPCESVVYKMSKDSKHNKQVTIFARISPHNAQDISINERGEVLVSNITSGILVLDQSGNIVRTFTYNLPGTNISCMSSRHLGITVNGTNKYVPDNLIVTDESGMAIHTWAGELDNGQKVASMHLLKLCCDRFDRLFIPDFKNNQVYVLPKDGRRVTCLLDKVHLVIRPTSVNVDMCGHVWIGCMDGTVHVMDL